LVTLTIHCFLLARDELLTQTRVILAYYRMIISDANG
jgi:hypothetical protein